MKICPILFLILISVISRQIYAQEEDIDASKPTNFYSFIDNTLEYSSQDNQNVFGYRGTVNIA